MIDSMNNECQTRMGSSMEPLSFANPEESKRRKVVQGILVKLLSEVDDLKNKGNLLYSAREYNAAEGLYDRGFEIVQTHILPHWNQWMSDPGVGALTSTIEATGTSTQQNPTDTISEQVQRLYVNLLSNLILTKISLQRGEEADMLASSVLNEHGNPAIQVCDSLLTYCRNYPKLWYRRAQAREALQLYKQSESDYLTCLSVLQKKEEEYAHGFSCEVLQKDIHDVTLALNKIRLKVQNEKGRREEQSQVKVEKRAVDTYITNQDEHGVCEKKIDSCDNHVDRRQKIVPDSSVSLSIRPPPSERQRYDIIQLLAQQQLQYYDISLQNNSSSSSLNGNNTILPLKRARPIQEGEAFFLINFQWWKKWCIYVDLFFYKEYKTVKEKCLRDTLGEGIKLELERKIQYIDRRRNQVLNLLPPGSCIPEDRPVKQKNVVAKKRSESESSSSSSQYSSSCDGSYMEDDEQFMEAIDNTSLFMVFDDLQVEPAGEESKTRCSDDIFYWEWRYRYVSSSAVIDNRSGRRQLLFLQPYLVRGFHYEIIPREVYAALRCWYGEVTPSICKRVTVQNGKLMVQLHPELQFRHPISSDDGPTVLQQSKYCAACGASRAGSRCKKCMKVYYCDRSCQISHWQYHKNECKRLSHGASCNSGSEMNQKLGRLAAFSTCSPVALYDSRWGQVGLNNLGNTCFLNSAVQCLSHTTPLTRYFLSDQFKRDLNPSNPLGTGGKLACAYETVVKELWLSKRTSISPSALKRAIALFAPQFAGSGQHDSQEFLAFLLDGLHEDLNRVTKSPYVEMPDFTNFNDPFVAGAEAWEAYSRRNKSLVKDSFYGQFKSTCVCPKCNRTSVSFDAFNHISLEIPPPKLERSISLVFFKATAQTSESSPVPKRYLISVPTDATWYDVKSSLANLSGTGNRRLALCDIHAHRICEIFNDKSVVPPVLEGDLGAFEIDPYSHTTIHAIVNQVRFRHYSDSQMFGIDSRIPFGFPFLTSFDASLTCEEVWNHLWSRVSYLFSETENTDFSSFLEVRLVNKDGTFLDHFPGSTNYNQNSCNEKSILPRKCTQKLSSYLGPVCTEDYLFIQLEWGGNKASGIFSNNRFLHFEDHPSTRKSSDKRRLSPKGSVTLEQCFEKFIKAERLDQFNQWYCSVCKEHVRAMKTMEFWKLPNILIIHLKRFEYKHAFRREKLETFVDYPIEELNMANFFASSPTTAGGDDDLFATSEVPAMYDLFGVINHFGRMGFGHYTAFSRRWNEVQIENEWTLFDDALVQRCDSGIVTPAAYVLFYRRRIFS